MPIILRYVVPNGSFQATQPEWWDDVAMRVVILPPAQQPTPPIPIDPNTMSVLQLVTILLANGVLGISILSPKNSLVSLYIQLGIVTYP